MYEFIEHSVYMERNSVLYIIAKDIQVSFFYLKKKYVSLFSKHWSYWLYLFRYNQTFVINSIWSNGGGEAWTHQKFDRGKKSLIFFKRLFFFGDKVTDHQGILSYIRKSRAYRLLNVFVITPLTKTNHLSKRQNNFYRI